MSLTVEIFFHMDAASGRDWAGDPEERPLTELGRRQADRIAEELGTQPVNAVFATPNVRCRQSVEPIAKRFGLEVQDVPRFADELDLRAQGANPLASAYLAGAAASDLDRIGTTLPNGRVVICSNGGDIVPGLMAYLAGRAKQSPIPKKLDSLRGGVYEVVFEGEKAMVSQREASPDFPV